MAKHEVRDVTPDANYYPGEVGESGTHVLPEGHEARKGLDVERAVRYPGAEKYADDVVIDGVVARSSTSIDPLEAAKRGTTP